MAGPLRTAIDKEIGVPTEPRVNPETATVGTSVVKVLSNNPNRFGFIIVNLSANTVFVAPDNAVSASRGIRLAANGGSFGVSWRDDFHLAGWEWHAIADAAGSTIFVIETVAR